MVPGGTGEGTAPVITGVPTISGTTGLGDTLTFAAASVTGDPTPTRTWQVRRDGSPAGSPQSGNTYEIVSDDLGTDFTVDQIETNTAGSTSATSAATSIPAAALVGMTVRRSSDNAEEEINDDADGYIDETALTTHTGANSGFVTSWRDDSGNGNHAVQTTSTQQPRVVNAGTVDEGVVFDGVNDFLARGARVTTGSVTKLFVSAWVKYTPLGIDRVLAGEYNTSSQRSWVIQDRPGDSSMALLITSSGLVTTDFRRIKWNVNPGDGLWHHVAFLFNPGTVTLYLDGATADSTVVDSAGSFPSSLFNTTAQFGIGSLNVESSPTAFWNGSLDDIRIAEGTAADDHAANIAAIYAGTYEGSPTAWYKFKDQTP
jgi:hypothetical protein